jgi:hypothetical protein
MCTPSLPPTNTREHTLKYPLIYLLLKYVSFYYFRTSNLHDVFVVLLEQFGRKGSVLSRAHFIDMEVPWFTSYPNSLQFNENAASTSTALSIQSHLVKDCQDCFNCKSSSDSYSSGSTFFMRCDLVPRCTLERLALDIFKYHTKDCADIDTHASGAEWWTQVGHANTLKYSFCSYLHTIL